MLVFFSSFLYFIVSNVCMILFSTYIMPINNINILTYSNIFHFTISIITYFTLRFIIIAPFGRHANITNINFKIPATISWALQESPTIMNVLYYILIEYPCKTLNCSILDWIYNICMHPNNEKFISLILESISTLHISIILFLIHYIHRSIIYPLLIHKGTPVPIHVTISATIYCIFNGRLQVLSNMKKKDLNIPIIPLDSYWYLFLFCIGNIIFFTGMRINIYSDYYLIQLKNKLPLGIYKIPFGGFFKYISCANFFGEIIEWCGYTLVIYSLCIHNSIESIIGACSFTIYVFSNLLPRGYAHHVWYLKQFGKDYEILERRAVIPFIY